MTEDLAGGGQEALETQAIMEKECCTPRREVGISDFSKHGKDAALHDMSPANRKPGRGLTGG